MIAVPLIPMRVGSSSSSSSSTSSATRKSVICGVVFGILCLKIATIYVSLTGPGWVATKVQSHHSSSWWPFRKNKTETLVKGGGRDFTLNHADGTISPKHHPEFVLGADPFRSLVLVPKGSPDRLVLSNATELKKGGTATLTTSTSTSSESVVVFQSSATDGVFGPWRYKVCGVVKGADTDRTAVKVRYVDDNFLQADGEDLVLDVKDWKMEAWSVVNFVGGTKTTGKDGTTFKAGGGRDWIVNEEDGTVSTKSNPDLVLGVDQTPVILVGKGSKDRLVFEELVGDGDDKTDKITLTLASPHEGLAVGKKYAESRRYEEWDYVESAVVPAEEALVVEYVDSNFLKLEGADLVLDVAWWKYYAGNRVNFVGAAAKKKNDVVDGGLRKNLVPEKEPVAAN